MQMAILVKYGIFRVQQGQFKYIAQMKHDHVVIGGITHDWVGIGQGSAGIAQE